MSFQEERQKPQFRAYMGLSPDIHPGLGQYSEYFLWVIDKDMPEDLRMMIRSNWVKYDEG